MSGRPQTIRNSNPEGTMFAVYRTLSLRYLAKRWFRAVLIIASIALGVSTLVATRALTETMNRAGLQASNPLAGTADLLVTGNGGQLIDLSFKEELSKVPGVVAIHPRLFTKARLPDLDNRSVLVVGIEIGGEHLKNPNWTITWKSHAQPDLTKVDLTKLGGAGLDLAVLGLSWWNDQSRMGLIGKELAESVPAKATQIKVQFPATKRKTLLIPVGEIDASGAFAALGGNTIVLDLESANAFLGLKNKASRLDVLTHPDVAREDVRGALQKVLRGRAEVHTPDESNEMIQNIFAGMQTGFTLCGVAALVVGLFLVYNVLAFSVAERRHEIGILLSVGATRRQVLWLFTGEAVFLGLAGSLLGIPLGMGLAYLGLQPVQEVLRQIFMELHVRQVEVSWQVILIALAGGILTAVAAALIPALKASAENPAEAVRRIPPKPTVRNRLLQIGASLLFILTGVSCILLGNWLPYRLGSFGGLVFVLLGTLVATPLLAALLGLILRPVVKQTTGIEGRLAADNLVRSASRTGIVIAALAAGVCLVMQTAGIIRSNQQGLQDWLDETITADLFVSSGSPVGAGIRSDPLSGALTTDLEKIPGIERAVPFKAISQALHGKVLISVKALDAGAMYRMEQQREKGNPLLQQLDELPDSAIISDNFAVLHHVQPGDVLTLNGTHGPVQLRVIGTMVDYSWNNGTVFINWRDYVRHWVSDKTTARAPLADAKVDYFAVFLRPGANSQQLKETVLRKLGAEHGLLVQTREEVLRYTNNKIESIYGISYGQLIVVMCVAALGVVTALLISVLQRRREMGLLRAIGASRLQVVRSVLAEAALMGLIGTIIGLVVGIPMEWYGLNVIMREEFGYQFALLIPWTESLLIAAAAVALATLAGLGPALYSVQQRIPEAIAYE
jgi:putative ABC transport system permease protein